MMIYFQKFLLQPCSSDCSHWPWGQQLPVTTPGWNILLLSKTFQHSHFRKASQASLVPGRFPATLWPYPLCWLWVTVTFEAQAWLLWGALVALPALSSPLSCSGCSSWSGFSPSPLALSVTPPAVGSSPSFPAAQESWALSMCLDSSAKGSENHRVS